MLPEGVEDWVFLNRRANRFDWQMQIRLYMISNKNDFDTIFDLLKEGGSSALVTGRKSRVELFERRLKFASDVTLQDLAGLLALKGESLEQLAA